MAVAALIVPFMWLSALGFVLSAYAHVTSLFGSSLIWGESVWFLHIGAFVVWLPAVLVSQRVMRDASQRDFWTILLSGCPPWMHSAQKILIGYVVVNFLYFMVTSVSRPASATTDPSVIQGFSGHWLIFYGLAFCILYSVHQKPELLVGRQCPAGHPVPHLAEYCGTCGARVDDTER